MGDLWVVLYDSQTGNVWAETVRGTRIEAIVFASFLAEAAGGAPRWHAAVLPAWMPLPNLSEILSEEGGFNVFTRWTAPANGVQSDAGASVAPTNEPDTLLGDEFVREWMEVFDRHRERFAAMRKRVADCGLTDQSPELQRMMVKCVEEAVAESLDKIASDPEQAIIYMLACFDRELTAYGCRPAGEAWNPWLVGGLALGGFVVVGGVIYFATD